MKNKIVEETILYISVPKEVICDSCGEKVSGIEDVTQCDIQTQYFSFGYGSRFDNCEFEVDICDDCLEEMFIHFQNNPLDKLDDGEEFE